MGCVARSIDCGYDADGYPEACTRYYMYCDKCGSFSIRTYLGLRRLVIIAAITMAFALVWNMLLGPQRSGMLRWWALFAVFAALLVQRAWHVAGHKCRKCGNTNITWGDVLSYTQRGLSDKIAGVPQHLVHTHDWSRINWYDDVAFVATCAVVILGLSSAPLIALIAILMVGARGLLRGTYSALRRVLMRSERG